MAIDLGSRQLTVSEKRRTWRIQAESPLNTAPHLEIFRELARVPDDGGEPTTYPDLQPIVINAAELDQLIACCQVPPELAAYIPNQATMARMLKLVPALLTILGDGAERYDMQRRERENGAIG